MISKTLIIRTKIFMYIGKALVFFAVVVGRLLYRKPLNQNVLLMIEAGKIGWTSVFYTELLRSAGDYLGPDQVVTSSIDRTKNYLAQSVRNIAKSRPTHFFYDPRTSSQNRSVAIFQTIVLTFTLTYFRITPIVILTDASVRQWRYQVFILTARDGVIVTFVDPKEMGDLFPHNRIVGPMFMPISIATLQNLAERRESSRLLAGDRNIVYFLGSLYSKRVDFFEKLQLCLSTIGSKVSIKTQSKSDDILPSGYWEKLLGADSIITTTFQQPEPKFIQDILGINQLVFRVSEALAAKSLLFSSSVIGMERYFKPGIDFVLYQDAEEAAKKIDFYFTNKDLAIKILEQGHRTYRELIVNKEFWKRIDLYLKKPLDFTIGVKVE